MPDILTGQCPIRMTFTGIKLQITARLNAHSMLKLISLTHLSLTSLLWDIDKQNSPRCDAAERGVPSGAILFAKRIFVQKLNKI